MEERTQLAAWSGWGALPEVFNSDASGWPQRTYSTLSHLLSAADLNAANHSTLNAHFTMPWLAELAWQLVYATGIGPGTTLEPGCGSGIFIATAPDPVRVVGVELDPITARIAQLIHPYATIHAQDFTDFKPDDSFAAVVGNVPFSQVKPYDPIDNPGRRLNLHNYVIAKALRLAKPGAPVVLITSSFTLDSANQSSRDSLAKLGRFIGSIRLPASTFQQHSGTQVVTDLIVIKAHQHGGWPNVSPHPKTGHLISDWYLQHPQLCVGEITKSAYRNANTVTLNPDHIPARTRQAAADLIDLAPELTPTIPPTTPTEIELPQTKPKPQRTVNPQRWEPGSPLPHWSQPGTILGTPDAFYQLQTDGTTTPFTPKPKSEHRQLYAAMKLRDALHDLLDAELSDQPDIETRRTQLNQTYETLARHYPTSITGPIYDKRGRSRTRPIGGFTKADPDWPSICALENVDTATGQITKAAIFTQRILRTQPAAKVETITDAIGVSIDETSSLNPALIAELLDTSIPETIRQLTGHAYKNPATGQWEHKAQYLSGNIRTKLHQAQEAAELDFAYKDNIKALTRHLPGDLAADDIDARLGASWITPADVQAFVAELLNLTPSQVKVTYTPITGWAFEAAANYSTVMTETWGTERMPATKIIEAALTQKAIRIYDTNPDGKQFINLDATMEAAEKLEAIHDHFATWIWDSDPERTQRLVHTYNTLFRSHIPPTYDGNLIQPVGMIDGFKLRQHQLAAIERIVLGKDCLLAHVVGAGKTATMVTASMTLKRQGRITKPCHVVPNHLVSQYSTEAKELFPTAQILTPELAEKGAKGRRQLIARIATGNWDLIVLPESVFTRIGVSDQFQAQYLAQQIEALTAAEQNVETAMRTRSRTVKQIAKRASRLAERLKELRAKPTDPGLGWSATGIDYLFVDECHRYKNLAVPTANPELLGNGESARATDLEMKILQLRAAHPNRGVITMATGTPIANRVAEAYIMQRFIQPDVLAHAKLHSFDAWAAQFGCQTTKAEISAAGDKWVTRTRFAKYVNVPDLMALFRVNADILLAQDLNLPRPNLKTGRQIPVVIPATPQRTQFMQTLATRAASLQKPDNMLAVVSDGRKAAMDLRLAGHQESATCKITVAADQITRIHYDTANNTYINPHSTLPYPTAGAFQIVFADLGVPKDGFNVYDQLATELTTRGIHRHQIAFIQDATSDAERAQLFTKCRDGRTKVLIGSTEKMGTGCNVQLRCIAVHLLDPTWRPCDMEQREGRALRQGNQNPEISILRYVSEGSMDIYAYQLLATKASFIGQALSGRFLDRQAVTETSEDSVSLDEMKALATGDPRIAQRAELIRQQHALKTTKRSWERRQHRLRNRIANHPTKSAAMQTKIQTLHKLAAHAPGNSPTIVVYGQTFHTFKDADQYLIQRLQTSYQPHTDVALIGGTLKVVAQRNHGQITLHPIDTTHDGTDINPNANPPPELLLAITRTARKATQRARHLQTLLTELDRDHQHAQQTRQQTFPNNKALIELNTQIAALDNQIFGDTDTNQQP